VLSIQEKLLILTQTPPNEPQVVQSESVKQKRSQRAEADDAKAVTTARAIAEEKRIVSEDVI
jgi:hypothetical protein